MAVAGCGGDGISADSVGECIKASGREVLVEKHEFLIYDTVRVRSPGNEARIDIWDDEDRAKEDVEGLRFEEEEPAQRGRYKLIENAVVSWDKVPSTEDDRAVADCLTA